MEEKIRAAIIEALRKIPELDGCLPDSIAVSIDGLSYRIEFNVPMPIAFAGA